MPRFVFAAVLVLILAVDTAVAEKWFSLYNKALYDLEAGRWQPAIAKLQEAVKQNPKSGQSMRVEANRTVRYFPYFLLGKAHFHLRQYEEASKYFAQERQHLLPGKLTSEIAGYQQEIRTRSERKRLNDFNQLVAEAESARKAGSPGSAAEQLQKAQKLDGAEFERRGLGKALIDLREAERKQLAAQEKQKTEAEFQSLVNQAAEKEKQGSVGEAAALLERAETLASARPEVTELKARIKGREDRYLSLNQEAAVDEREGRLDEALAKLKEAAQLLPERAKADKMAEAIEDLARRAEIAGLLNAGTQAIGSRDYRQATEIYDRVLVLDKTNATAHEQKARARSLTLVTRASELAQERSFAEALDAFELALATYAKHGELVYDEMRPHLRNLAPRRGGLLDDWLAVMRTADPSRSDKERLGRQASGRRPTTRVSQPAPEETPVDALTALQVHPEEAVRILERLRATRKTGNAELESWTGVAYARLSLLSTDAARKERLRETAQQHFRLARQLNPGYRPNPRLVPPQIMRLFDSAGQAE
ncbi:MAG: hypothetical protein EHM61_09420 [Acidobacteria bacterium]|nr:MAG: hypothetical protein EHM61_09420 [Acidobacteriota bacterium]